MMKVIFGYHEDKTGVDLEHFFGEGHGITKSK